MMGRFVERDHFIGLALYRRSFLKWPSYYHSIAEKFPAHWGSVFGNIPFVRGNTIDDYLSQPAKDPYASIA